jgi:electron transfer flavoprotein alpha/beta subunit
MKILVSVKRVVDFNVRIQVKPDGSGVATEGVKHSMNPFDEIAMEEAMRLKEKGKATEIVAVTIGGAKCEETLRTALAFGADRAIHVKEEGEVQPLTAARYLKLPDIMKAKKKPVENVTLADLGVEAAAPVKAVKTAPPPVRGKGVMVKTVDELIAALKQKGLV